MAETIEERKRRMTATPEKAAKKKDAVIIPNSLSELDNWGISKEELEEMVQRDFLIDGLIKEKSHTVIFGASGTGKTTLMFYLAKKAKDRNVSLKVYYFLLDGADEIALNGMNFYDDASLKILNTVQSREIMNQLTKAISEKQDLPDTLFVFDTYKKFQTDVNNKGANTGHMHILRELTGLGATVVSIAHTNKDGKQFSGTAEMEQDSDAVIRVDRMIDPVNENLMTVSFSSGGRVRWKFTPQSFTLPVFDPNPKLVDEVEYVDLRDAEFFTEVSEDIAAIRLSLANDGDANQKTLYERLSEDIESGRDMFAALLRKGRGKFWKGHKGTKNSYVYSCKD